MDYNTYNYYKNNELSNYKVIYEQDLNTDYNFILLNTNKNKAFVSLFKYYVSTINTDLYKSNYPEVKDGWYEPSVGGNYYYNLKGGYSFGKNDITIVAGKIISQDFKTKPLFPIFTQIGYNIKF